VCIDRQTTFHGDALAQAMTPATSAASATIRQLGLMLAHWGNPFGSRLPSSVAPSALAYLESVLVPKARMLAYQDGFLIVAFMFFLSLLPAWLMRRRSISGRQFS